jgi:hypothetical protein
MAIHLSGYSHLPISQLRGYNVWKKRNSLRRGCTQQVHCGDYSFQRRLEASGSIQYKLGRAFEVQGLAKEEWLP